MREEEEDLNRGVELGQYLNGILPRVWNGIRHKAADSKTFIKLNKLVWITKKLKLFFFSKGRDRNDVRDQKKRETDGANGRKVTL